MVADGEGAEVVGSHFHFAQSADGDGECAGDGGGGELCEGGFFAVFDDVDPVVVFVEHLFDVVHGDVLFEFDGECLGV